MIHRTKKVKFHSGSDSNKMILRKLLTSFFIHSHVETTEKKARVLKTFLDRIVAKTREETQANKNYLLRYFPKTSFISVLFTQVGPAVKAIEGGYVRTVRIAQRQNDASTMVRVEWAHPVVLDWGGPEKNIKSKELPVQPAEGNPVKNGKGEKKKVSQKS